jgi:hypothetical protein
MGSTTFRLSLGSSIASIQLGESPRGIPPRGARRTVREPLSTHTGPGMEPRRTPICQWANNPGARRERHVSQCVARRRWGRSFLYFRLAQRARSRSEFPAPGHARSTAVSFDCHGIANPSSERYGEETRLSLASASAAAVRFLITDRTGQQVRRISWVQRRAEARQFCGLCVLGFSPRPR